MRGGGFVAALLLVPSHAFAQDTAAEPLPPAPDPATAPAPGEAAEEEEKLSGFGYFGLGPTMLSISSRDGFAPVTEYGLALSAGGRSPLNDWIGLNVGVTWGLTSWERTERWWGAARRVGGWTSRAYGNVTEWADSGEDDETLRWFAAVYAYVGLAFPYIASGLMYVAGPIGASSYLDLTISTSFHLQELRKGPYVSTGIGTMAYIHPQYGELRGALGPSLGAGFDFGWFGVEARGLVSPAYLHGEANIGRTDIFTGSFLLRVQGK